MRLHNHNNLHREFYSAIDQNNFTEAFDKLKIFIDCRRDDYFIEDCSQDELMYLKKCIKNDHCEIVKLLIDTKQIIALPCGAILPDFNTYDKLSNYAKLVGQNDLADYIDDRCQKKWKRNLLFASIIGGIGLYVGAFIAFTAAGILSLIPDLETALAISLAIASFSAVGLAYDYLANDAENKHAFSFTLVSSSLAAIMSGSALHMRG